MTSFRQTNDVSRQTVERRGRLAPDRARGGSATGPQTNKTGEVRFSCRVFGVVEKSLDLGSKPASVPCNSYSVDPIATAYFCNRIRQIVPHSGRG
jgi:hypothetical protein